MRMPCKIKRLSQTIIITTLASLLLVSPLAHSKKRPVLNFNKLDISASQKLSGKILYINETNTDVDLLIQNKSSLSYYPQFITKGKDSAVQLIEIPANVQSFNKGKLATNDKEVLFYFTGSEVLAYDFVTKESISILRVDSLFKHQENFDAVFGEFINDINEDGLTDIVTYSFTHTNLYIQQESGEFKHFDFDLPPKVEQERDGVLFRPHKYYHVDVNNDDRKDITFRIKDQLVVFTQNSERNFNKTPVKINLNSGLAVNESDDSKDKKLSVEINTIEDINNDGIIDLITKESKSDGLISRTSQLKIRYGYLENNITAFNAKHDGEAEFKGEGMIEFKDINGDGFKDYYTLSVELGFGTILDAISGSIEMDMRFYPSNKNGEFDQEPAYENEIDIAINSGGDGGVNDIDDFNGDGLKDLLLRTDDDEFKIFSGSAKSLFLSRGVKYKNDMPDNVRIEVKDFNGDDKADILFLYSTYFDDDEEKEVGKNHIKLWLSKIQ